MFFERLFIILIYVLWGFVPSGGITLFRKQKKKKKNRKCVDTKLYCQELKESILQHFPGTDLGEWKCSSKKDRKFCPVFCGVCKQTSGPSPAPSFSNYLPTYFPTPNPSADSSTSPVLTYKPGELTVSENGLILSTGLKSRIIATSGEKVKFTNGGKSDERFHDYPDGAAVFSKENIDGWVYVSNSEDSENGGVGAIYFDGNGDVIDYKMILKGTRRNCGGGKTPWDTWLTCEEAPGGHVFEINPWNPHNEHDSCKTHVGHEVGDYYEAAAYDNRDPYRPQFFVTTDTSAGAIVKFTPNPDKVSEALASNDFSSVLHAPGNHSYLVLKNLSGNNGTFAWSESLTDGRISAYEHFPYSEGIDVRDGILYFTTKKYKRLFILDLDAGTYIESSTESGAFNNQPDQIARIIGPGNDDILYFCEDGGADCGVHGRNSDGKYFTILEGLDYETETTGLAFSPNNKHMYVSFQSDPGQIFDITREDGLPFDGARLDIKYHQME